jgi:hypothetical protein
MILAKFEIGPPSGGFPLASLFLISMLGVCLVEIYLLNVLSGFVMQLSFAVLIIMLVYAIFGRALQSAGGMGQLGFVLLGVGVFYFSNVIQSTFGIHLSLVPLSVGGLTVLWGTTDITILFALFLIGSLAYVAYNERDSLGKVLS